MSGSRLNMDDLKEAMETLRTLLKPGVFCKVTFNIINGKLGDSNVSANVKRNEKMPKEIVEILTHN